MRFKTWLRGPAEDPQVELIGEDGRPWRAERSIMRELLTPEEARHLEIAEGRWFLPGTPP